MIRPIAYIHIPKTAGNTVNRFLFQEVSPAKMLDRAEDPLVTPDDFARCDIVSGHLTFLGIRKRLGDRHAETTYLSCVREPVSRLKSNLFYHPSLGKKASMPKSLSLETIREKGFEWTLRTALELGPQNPDFCKNPQWGFLATNRGAYHRLASEVSPDRPEGIARNFLKSYAGIIVQDRLDDGITYLGYRTRLLIPRRLGRQNSNDVKPSDRRCEINDEALIEEVCGLDQAIFDVAKREFAARYAEMVADVLTSRGFSETRFRAADQEGRYSILRDLLNKQILAEREKKPVVGPSSPGAGVLGRTGVYPGAATTAQGCRLVSDPKRRWLIENGSPVTNVLWVGPAMPAELWVRPATVDSWFAFKATACFSYGCLTGLKVTCDGESADYRIVIREGNWLIVFPLGQKAGPTHIVISAPDVPHIYEVNAQADPISKNNFHKVAIGIDERAESLTEAEIGKLPLVELSGAMAAPVAADGGGPIALINGARISGPPGATGIRLERIIIAGPSASTVILRADRNGLDALDGGNGVRLTFYLRDGRSFARSCDFDDVLNSPPSEAKIELPLGRTITQMVGFAVDQRNGIRTVFQPCGNVSALVTYRFGLISRLGQLLLGFLHRGNRARGRALRMFHIVRILTAEQNVSTVMLFASKKALSRVGGFGPFFVTFLVKNGQSFDLWCYFEDVPDSPFAKTQINVSLGRVINQIVGFTVDDRNRNRVIFQPCENVDAITTVV